MTDTALARSSDDFWPRDVASHTTHVAINAGNSVFMAALVQPDWDMFQSQHPAAVLHASARVVRAGNRQSCCDGASGCRDQICCPCLMAVPPAKQSEQA